MGGAAAMDFTMRGEGVVVASGSIEQGDAAKFRALPAFNVLELDSPGGLVSEALAIAANMDQRDNIRTVVKPGASCASTCAMVLFVSGSTRVVEVGGRLGIRSCAKPDGTKSIECNKEMADNATQHGVPWGVIEGFGNQIKPSDMLWLNAEDAECWGLMKWKAEDRSNTGIDCYRWSMHLGAQKVSAFDPEDPDFVACRANAGTSRTYAPSGDDKQGFSSVYRSVCERIAADPRTPKYAAIDIILWLTLTDPNITPLKPGTLMVNILGHDESQLDNCWKCLTISGMTELMHGYPKEAVEEFRQAVDVVKRDTGSAPEWLTSRMDIAVAEAAKKKH
jgi:hypothetical protein